MQKRNNNSVQAMELHLFCTEPSILGPKFENRTAGTETSHTHYDLVSAACVRQWTVSALVQIMACRLVGAEPLFEPMLEY